MDATYYQGRLATSLAMMNAAADPCAKAAHEGLAAGYRARIAVYGPPHRAMVSRQMRRDLDAWTNEGGAIARGRA